MIGASVMLTRKIIVLAHPFQKIRIENFGMGLYQTNLIIIYQKKIILNIMIQKSGAFMMSIFPYHLYKDEKEYDYACKKAEKTAKVWEINSMNRIKKENELKAKLYKEKLDRIRLGIHKELLCFACNLAVMHFHLFVV